MASNYWVIHGFNFVSVPSKTPSKTPSKKSLNAKSQRINVALRIRPILEDEIEQENVLEVNDEVNGSGTEIVLTDEGKGSAKNVLCTDSKNFQSESG